MMEMMKYFQVWGEQLGMTPQELEQEYKQFEEEYKKMFPNDSEEIRTVRLRNRLQAYHSHQFKSNAKEFETIIVGAGGMYDTYAKERKEAEAKGFVDEKGKPVFFSKRFEWKFKQNGEEKQVAIPTDKEDESWARRVYGVFKQKDTDTWNKGILFLNGRKLCNSLPPFFTPTKVKLNVGEAKEGEEVILLNSTTVTKFFYDKNTKTIDFKEMSKDLLPQNVVPFTELIGITNSDQYPLGLLIIEGTVVNVNMTKDEIKSNVVEIMKTSQSDEDALKIGTAVETKTIWVPKDIPLNFGVGSEVMVVCQKSTRPDKEGKNVESYNGLGIYVTVNMGPTTEIKSIAELKEEESVDGTAWRAGGN
jgi:hypothetical protein